LTQLFSRELDQNQIVVRAVNDMIISDEKILRAPNEDVKPEEVGELVAALEKGLNYSALMGRQGIGLAAPQIGINKKAAIVRISNSSQDLNVNLINARIEKGYLPTLFKDEGCLSFNGQLKDTMRYQEIYVVDNAVEPYSFVATGLMAVAIQHELDHLNGVLFFDREVAKNPLKVKVRPNDPCICGSGKKFKRCCVNKEVR
jgi:peptide deformylase